MGRERNPNISAAARLGMNATIAEIAADGTITVGGVPGVPMLDFALRAADLRPVWAAFAADILDPDTYMDPEGIRGGGTHGAIDNDPGYLRKGAGWKQGGKNSPHLHVKKTKMKFGVSSSRPFFGRFKKSWEEKVVKAIELYMATGKVQHG